MEFGSKGIRVNTIHPNAVYDTGIWTDEVLQQADLVTGSAEDGGAAVILERIAAGSWPATGQQMKKGDPA